MAKVTNPIRTISLELSKVEAETLLYVMEHVGGCPRSSPRSYTDDITQALMDAGIKAPDHHSRGSIYFGSEKS